MGISGAALRDDFARRVVKLEDRLRRLETTRRLEAATIGSGGLRVAGGTITIDSGGNIVISDGKLIAGPSDGAHTEITETGYRVFNDDGQIVVDLTATGTNQILLRGSGSSENEILLNASGEMNGRVLNVDEVNLDGEDLSGILTSIWNKIRDDTESSPDSDPPPAAGTITRTYDATWSQAYQGDGDKNNFADGIAQGYFSGTNGNQKSMIGFNSAAIQADHAGRTVTRARVFLYFDHWYFNAGGTAVLGHHGEGQEPSQFTGTTDTQRSANWPKPGGRWVRYTHDLTGWKSGAKKGIVIGPGPSTSREYYGNARAHNQSKAPKLEIRSTA